MEDTVTISKEEYEILKRSSSIDSDLLMQLIKSLKDVKCGRIRRVK